VAADFFDRSRNSHCILLKLFHPSRLLRTEHNLCPRKIVGRQFKTDIQLFADSAVRRLGAINRLHRP
ncbi:MAG: hypothetical protein K2X78_14840, partial [Burkholderiaceae bacterium]|nr:hypothetical protein [Burkholderiaceae bacterium]